MLASVHHVGVNAIVGPVNVKFPSVQDSSWLFNPCVIEGLNDHCNLTRGLHRDIGRGSHILASWKLMYLETAAGVGYGPKVGRSAHRARNEYEVTTFNELYPMRP
jgi:hypothetical protein